MAILDVGGHLSTLEDKTIDARYRSYSGQTPNTGNILIVEITEESLKRLEPVYDRWPWPRSAYAEALTYLSNEGALAVGFDILFSEESGSGTIDRTEINALQAFAANADIAEVRRELISRLDELESGTGDESLVSAVKKSDNVFLPAVFHVDENSALKSPGLASNNDKSGHIRKALSSSKISHAPAHGPEVVFYNATVPFDALSQASKGIGHINLFPDDDGTVRRFRPFLHFKEKEDAYPALPLLMAARLKGISPEQISAGKESISIGGSSIPLLPDGSALIPYQGGQFVKGPNGQDVFESFYRRIPFEYLLASKDQISSGLEPIIPHGTFKDKIVLVTVSAIGLSDMRTTPFGSSVPGIEVHANVLDAVISDKRLTEPGAGLMAVYILALALAIAAISRFAGPVKGFALVMLGAGSVIFIHWKFFESGYAMPIAKPGIAMLGTYFGVLVLKYVSEYREKGQIRAAFGRYVPKAVLEEVLRSPEKLRLGGQRRRMTVLFSDVEGFTALAEHIAPEETSRILTEYLSSMVECVMRTGGTLDKFIGDAVMAIWNAPVEDDRHGALACEAALLMQEAGKKHTGPDGSRLNTRIGINTGEMVVGNLGSREIFDYTVLGSEVNTASRLEPLNKDFGTCIAVSLQTRLEAERHMPGTFVFRRLAKVTLKGRNTPMEVHELVCLSAEASGQMRDMIKNFEEGLELFASSSFSEAKKRFEEALARVPEDGPSKAYIAMCGDYLKDPPAEGWDGTYRQKTK